jgi:hypothetical protein
VGTTQWLVSRRAVQSLGNGRLGRASYVWSRRHPFLRFLINLGADAVFGVGLWLTFGATTAVVVTAVMVAFSVVGLVVRSAAPTPQR